MKRHPDVIKLSLQPFTRETIFDDYGINVLYLMEKSGLHIVYSLDAPLDDLILPEFEWSGNRRTDGLWEHTCFEIFLGSNHSPDYREFNLSPSGAWNVYAFTGYRKGMKPEPLFKTLPFDVRIFSDYRFELSISIDPGFIKGSSNTVIGLSAVLEHMNGKKSYWALSHPENAPDFHDRKSWLYRL